MNENKQQYLDGITQAILSAYAMADKVKKDSILEKVPVDFQTKSEEELKNICLDLDSVINI